MAIRFATFNASLSRNSQGRLIKDLSVPTDRQAQSIAEIIQRVNPDVILINEFDFDPDGTAAQLFQENYLEIEQNVSGNNSGTTLTYPYTYLGPSNTGIHSGFDLDKNGKIISTPEATGYAGDAWGFGNFEGQFAMIIYSKYPIVMEKVRTFRHFLWKDMPDALLPDNWYAEEELAKIPLSSKSHWDLPLKIKDKVIQVLASHPTPPVFDGTEGRNKKRNHDEIRFWVDYITPGQGDYIYDDQGEWGGLTPGSQFVIMGDQNADPFDGDSCQQAARQLLDNSLINTRVTPSSKGGVEDATISGGANNYHLGNPAFDTARFNPAYPGNLRVDYVLPASNLAIINAKVFWPVSRDALHTLVDASDHRLVFVEVV